MTLSHGHAISFPRTSVFSTEPRNGACTALSFTIKRHLHLELFGDPHGIDTLTADLTDVFGILEVQNLALGDVENGAIGVELWYGERRDPLQLIRKFLVGHNKGIAWRDRPDEAQEQNGGPCVLAFQAVDFMAHELTYAGLSHFFSNEIALFSVIGSSYRGIEISEHNSAKDDFKVKSGIVSTV